MISTKNAHLQYQLCILDVGFVEAHPLVPAPVGLCAIRLYGRLHL